MAGIISSEETPLYSNKEIRGEINYGIYPW